MKIEIENSEIVRVINFLDKLNLVGLKGIHRTKLSKILIEKAQEVQEGEKKIIEDFKDDNKKIKEELEAYHKEKAVVDGGDSQTMLQSVKSTIKNLVSNEEDGPEFEGADAYGLFALYEAFEIGGEE